MLVASVDEPLVHLIAEAQCVMFNAEVSDHLQLVSGENLREKNRNHQSRSSSPSCQDMKSLHFSNILSGDCDVYNTCLPYRIVGSVDDDGLCLGVEFTGKLVWVKNPVSTCDGRLSRLLKDSREYFLS